MIRIVLTMCVAFALAACTTTATSTTEGAVPRDAWGRPVTAGK
ncbi:hypothetical protein ACFOMD_06545 [Sphingoaurantiacus capsulatus]|uniref:Lipoprotein n=1 Tax=Sphingoaurantiacus capsulatus TaxID=1771310 RepID=A0ABV7X9V4_9SPHN